jgi:hypothetical protein
VSDFDPDAYAQAGEDKPAAFDPDTYAAAAPAPAKTAGEGPISDDEILRMVEWAKKDPAFAKKFEPVRDEAMWRHGKKVLGDMGAVGADAQTLGWADEALAALGRPDLAQGFKERVGKFRKEHPGMALGSSLLSTLPLAAIGNPGAIGSAALGAAAGLGNSEDKGVGDAAVGGLVGALSWLLGQGIGVGAQKLTGKVGKLLGRGLQKPQEVYEKAAEAVGRNADDVAATAKPSSGSKLQRDLGKAVNAGELAKLGPEVGGAARVAEEEFVAGVGKSLDDVADDVLGRQVASLTPMEREALMRAMAKGMGVRGLKVDPADVGANFDELVRNAGLDPAEVSVREAIRRVNQRDPAFARQLELNTWERWKPLLQKMNVDPRIIEAIEKNQAVQRDFIAGLQNRFGVLGEQGGKGQMSVKAVHELAEEALAPGAVRDTMVDTVVPKTVTATKIPSTELEAFPFGAQPKTGQGAADLYNPNGIAGAPKPDATEAWGREGKRALHKEALKAWHESPGGKAEQKAIMEEVNAATRGRSAVNPLDLGAPKPVVPLDLGTPKRTSADVIREGAEAVKRLRAINAGKKKIEHGIGGAAILGVPGARMLGGARVLASDAVAGTGRSIEAAGARISSPEALAKSWLKNPSLLEPLAQRPDKIGKGARWALEGLEMGGDGFKSRLFILTMQPWFRADVATQKDESGEQQPEQ